MICGWVRCGTDGMVESAKTHAMVEHKIAEFDARALDRLEVLREAPRLEELKVGGDGPVEAVRAKGYDQRSVAISARQPLLRNPRHHSLNSRRNLAQTERLRLLGEEECEAVSGVDRVHLGRKDVATRDGKQVDSHTDVGCVNPCIAVRRELGLCAAAAAGVEGDHIVVIA
jgi:hypothetical protein